LTHHEILRLVAPFTRGGHHVDLAASDRGARRLVFKEVAHGDDASACAGGRETLALENPRPDLYRLIRTVTPRCGPVATLTVEGAEPGDLLARIEAVAPERQFRPVGDCLIALSHRIVAANRSPDEIAPPLVLTSAEVRLPGLTLKVNADTGRGYPAEITLVPPADSGLQLPDDLFATLGWDWQVLRRRAVGLSTTLRVPRREPARSRRIEIRLERAVAHVAQTLAEPPRRFHDRLARARWGVAFRRTLPLLACIALIAGTAALTLVKIPQDSMLLMLIFNLPPLLLLMLFGMRELPRLEIPPLPRRSSAVSWRQPPRPPSGLLPT
jgi:hypothetical protein